VEEIVMPRLSDSMEEGTILLWLKADGERVERGEELVEIETDKANMTYESDQAGTLTLLAAEGDTLPVGSPIARVDEVEGAAPAGAAARGDEAPATTERTTPPSAPASPAAPAAQPATPPSAPAPPAAAPAGERVKASPLARRIAQESGVDLHDVTPTGPGGRIVKADVLSSTNAPAPAAAGEPAPAEPAEKPDVMTAKGETTLVELTRLQQAVARRMAESKATIPDFALHVDVDMEACVALRAELKQVVREDAHERAPTYNDMVVKACALALREHPKANGSYRDGQLQLHSRVNVGVAVAAQDALVVPTVFDADFKALGEIARETHRLASRVREQTITPPELGGGTFTVSNLGMFGIVSFSAIINPPQAAIMSVGALDRRAVVHDGAPAVRNTMPLTLVCDHRILYGAEAAKFLARVRELLEAPAALTL
jgi:pyruvate dehydrogenase E2 component (dihydrolipoamide acetyltransferase)